MIIKRKYYQTMVIFGLFWAFFITVLRAMRWPNDWAEAHWLISYKFGFIKRALPGTLIAPFTNSGNAELVIKIVSTVFFLLFCAVLFWISVRIIKKSQFDINSVLVAFVFMTSPYIVMSGHLNGYFDNICIIISVFACLLVIRGKIWLSSIVLSVGVLIHETIFLIGFPAVIFLALIQLTKEVSSSVQLFIRFISRYKVLIIIPVLTFFAVIIYQIVFLDSAIIKNQLISHLSQFNFIQHHRSIAVPIAFTTSFFDYLKSESPAFFDRITDQRLALHIGLPLLILIYYGWYHLRKIAFNRLIFFWALVVVTLIPLSLHIIAWDTSRIWTYPLVVAMLILWGIHEIFPTVGIKERESLLFCIIAIIVMVFQLFILTPLMDDAEERFSNEKRIILYAPALIIIALFVSKHDYLKISQPPVVNKEVRFQ